MIDPDQEVDRNLQGIEEEKKGNIQAAAGLYLQNVLEGATTPHPYERLSLLLKRQGRVKEALSVIELFFKNSNFHSRIADILIKRRQALLKQRQIPEG